jgi:hypothetical protein
LRLKLPAERIAYREAEKAALEAILQGRYRNCHVRTLP